MTPRPAGRAAAVVAALALALLAPGGGHPAAARDLGRRAPAPAATGASIRLVSQPTSVGPDDDFPVFVDVTGAPPGSDLAVDIFHRITKPADLDHLGNADPWATFDVVPLGAHPTAGPERSGFDLRLYSRGGRPRPAGTWSFRLDEAGVYPIRIRLHDAGDAKATLYTTLLRRPGADETVPMAKVALVNEIHQTVPTDATQRAATDRADPAVARGTSTLLRALAAHPTVPATVSITPDTALRLRGDPRTKGLLRLLRGELHRANRSLLDAPYVAIDPSTLVADDLEPEIARQRDLGRLTLAELFGSNTTDTWDLTQPVDEAGLAAVRGRGTYRVLLPGGAFDGGAPAVPADLAAGDGEVRALAVSPALQAPRAGREDPILDAHRLLARLALTAQANPAQSDLVVTVDAASVDRPALTVVLDALTLGTPFFAVDSLDHLLDDTPSAQPPTLRPPSPPDLGTYPERSREVHAAVDSYASMVPDRPTLVHRYDRALALTAAVGLGPGPAVSDLDRIGQQVQDRFDAVSTPPVDQVTLGARDARFPLVITSRLPYPVHVTVELEANDRLVFPRNDIPVTVGGSRTVASIRVRTRASGDTPVRITVRSADGQVILSESRYTIRSTAVSGVGVLITIGAAGFLALWWGRHWWHDRRAPRPATVDGGPDPVPDADPGAEM